MTKAYEDAERFEKIGAKTEKGKRAALFEGRNTTKMNNRRKIMTKTFWIAIVAIIICLCAARLVRPSFAPQSETVTASPEEEARIRETIQQMVKDYEGKNQSLFKQFEKALKRSENKGFNKARANVRPFVKDVTSIKYSSQLCYAMALDKIRGGDRAMEMLTPKIVSMIVQPCEEGHAEIVDALNNFLLKVQENDTQFKAGIAQLLENENFSVLDLETRDRFLQNNMQLAGKIQGFALEKTFTMVGVALEIVFIRSTYEAISKAFGPIVIRIVSTLTTGGTATVADGPLPIGDIIFGTIAIGCTAWTAYDLYQVTKTLPAEMQKHTTSMIDDYQKESRKKALEQAKSVLQLCHESTLQISKELN